MTAALRPETNILPIRSTFPHRHGQSCQHLSVTSPPINHTNYESRRDQEAVLIAQMSNLQGSGGKTSRKKLSEFPAGFRRMLWRIVRGRMQMCLIVE